MGLAEQMERQRLRDEDAAEAHDEHLSALSDEFGGNFDQLVQARRLDTPTGIKHLPRMSDVLIDAMARDEDIYDEILQGLLHCAAKGQVEAIQALQGVREFYVEQRIEHRNKQSRAT